MQQHIPKALEFFRRELIEIYDFHSIKTRKNCKSFDRLCNVKISSSWINPKTFGSDGTEKDGKWIFLWEKTCNCENDIFINRRVKETSVWIREQWKASSKKWMKLFGISFSQIETKVSFYFTIQVKISFSTLIVDFYVAYALN